MQPYCRSDVSGKSDASGSTRQSGPRRQNSCCTRYYSSRPSCTNSSREGASVGPARCYSNPQNTCGNRQDNKEPNYCRKYQLCSKTCESKEPPSYCRKEQRNVCTTDGENLYTDECKNIGSTTCAHYCSKYSNQQLNAPTYCNATRSNCFRSNTYSNECQSSESRSRERYCNKYKNSPNTAPYDTCRTKRSNNCNYTYTGCKPSFSKLNTTSGYCNASESCQENSLYQISNSMTSYRVTSKSSQENGSKSRQVVISCVSIPIKQENAPMAKMETFYNNSSSRSESGSQTYTPSKKDLNYSDEGPVSSNGESYNRPKKEIKPSNCPPAIDCDTNKDVDTISLDDVSPVVNGRLAQLRLETTSRHEKSPTRPESPIDAECLAELVSKCSRYPYQVTWTTPEYTNVTDIAPNNDFPNEQNANTKRNVSVLFKEIRPCTRPKASSSMSVLTLSKNIEENNHPIDTSTKSEPNTMEQQSHSMPFQDMRSSFGIKAVNATTNKYVLDKSAGSHLDFHEGKGEKLNRRPGAIGENILDTSANLGESIEPHNQPSKCKGENRSPDDKQVYLPDVVCLPSKTNNEVIVNDQRKNTTVSRVNDQRENATTSSRVNDKGENTAKPSVKETKEKDSSDHESQNAAVKEPTIGRPNVTSALGMSWLPVLHLSGWDVPDTDETIRIASPCAQPHAIRPPPASTVALAGSNFFSSDVSPHAAPPNDVSFDVSVDSMKWDDISWTQVD